jgi:hypothetical protein
MPINHARQAALTTETLNEVQPPDGGIFLTGFKDHFDVPQLEGSSQTLLYTVDLIAPGSGLDECSSFSMYARAEQIWDDHQDIILNPKSGVILLGRLSLSADGKVSAQQDNSTDADKRYELFMSLDVRERRRRILALELGVVPPKRLNDNMTGRVTSRNTLRLRLVPGGAVLDTYRHNAQGLTYYYPKSRVVDSEIDPWLEVFNRFLDALDIEKNTEKIRTARNENEQKLAEYMSEKASYIGNVVVAKQIKSYKQIISRLGYQTTKPITPHNTTTMLSEQAISF